MPLTTLTAPVAQIVKQETAMLHEEVEHVFLPKLQGIQSIQDYAAVLQMFYSYFHPLEELIHQQISSTELPDISQRRTSFFALQDLHALGLSETFLECRHLPVITTPSQAFGALYVLEGSTLGGRVIMKMLANQRNVIIPVNALRFFNGYGEQTGKMWTAFVHMLNQQEDIEAIVATAGQTFLYLKQWMQECFAHE